ncbi:MAG: amidohydrolase family protein [Isosphaeraceae bacterium]
MRVVSAAVFLMIGSLLAGPAAAGLEEPQPGHLFFKCRLVINPSEGKAIPDAIIEVAGGKILEVGGAAEVPIAPGAKVVDFGDKFIIPGLVDTHGHLYTFSGRELRKTNPLIPPFYLAAGVTSVGDPGSMDFAGDVALRDQIDSGQVPGPRFFLAGEYIQMPPKLISWMKHIETPDQARAIVDDAARQGAAAIKIYNHMQGDVLRAAIERAHGRSMRVWAHVGAVSFQQAIDMGVDQLFHGVLVMADGRKPGTPVDDFARWIREAGDLDLEAPGIRAMFRSAARRKVVLTPTVAVEELFWCADPKTHHLEEQQRFYTPAGWASVQASLKAPIRIKVSTEEFARERKKNQEFIRRAHEAGCLLSTGTDYTRLSMLPGWSLWREMEIFAEAGLPPMAVLKAATWNGIYAIGRTDQLGSLEPGKMADFVVLDANPLDRIENVRRVHRVVKGGVIYDLEALLAPLVGKVD